MKKTLLCATAAAAFATVGATAHAEDGWYARADAQFSFEGTLDQDGATDVIGTIGQNDPQRNRWCLCRLGLWFRQWPPP
jgi:hypothetical protein